MVYRQSVPDYLTNRKNTLIQVIFTAILAYIFINIYRPFGYDDWYKVRELNVLIASAVVVVTGMIVVIISRLVMLYLQRSYEITIAVYIWFIVAEVFFMGVFFTIFEIFILNDKRSPLLLLFNAVQNTALILLIPYAITTLYFAWSDIKKRFDSVAQQFRSPSDIFIPFKDEKGVLRVTIKSSDLLFIEANDNYVNIHYLDNNREKKMIVRNTLKSYEKQLKDYPVYRVHRKFSVNIKNVKMLMKGSKGYELVINSENGHSIPISNSYEKKIIEIMSSKVKI